MHMTPVHQLMSCEVKKKLIFYEKQIHYQDFFQTVASIIHNNASSSEKVHLHQNNTVLDCFLLLNGAWSVHISLEKPILWIENYLEAVVSFKQWFEFKNILMNLSIAKSFSLLKVLIGGLELCGLLVMINVMFFISCLDSHSDRTHSLKRNH